MYSTYTVRSLFKDPMKLTLPGGVQIDANRNNDDASLPIAIGVE